LKAKNKTSKNEGDIGQFLQSVENPKRKEDALVVFNLMKKVVPENPNMWGSSIVGFGTYHYKYESGREGDFFKVGFSPRNTSLTIYIMPGFQKYEELMDQLGKHTTGKSCLYIRKLEDIDLHVLEQLVKTSYGYMTRKYG
jgi:hypothetical protein